MFVVVTMELKELELRYTGGTGVGKQGCLPLQSINTRSDNSTTRNFLSIFRPYADMN